MVAGPKRVVNNILGINKPNGMLNKKHRMMHNIKKLKNIECEMEYEDD